MLVCQVFLFICSLYSTTASKVGAKTSSKSNSKSNKKVLNVVLILVDDLGYGDLGWGPYRSEEMKAVKTPKLEKMAEEGLVMTNFHVASPMCSPSRASIMLGLFPWRLGVDFIYAGDLKKDGSMEMDKEQMPLLPNVAISFRDAGYYTAHIGKWHLGGQNIHEVATRYGPLAFNSSCFIPGINQYGFDEYVGMTEGKT